MNSLARRLAVVAGTTAVGIGLAAPAQAQYYARTDATNDVTVTTCTDESGSDCTDTIAAAGNQPDITRIVTTHTTTQVKAFAKYADISASGARLHQLRVVTGAGRHVRLSVVTANGPVVVKELTRDSDGRKIACSGLGFKADYARNTVLLTIPQSCLGNPSYVRVGFGSAIFSSETKFRGDDALLSGLSPHTQDLKLGPSLSRY